MLFFTICFISVDQLCVFDKGRRITVTCRVELSWDRDFLHVCKHVFMLVYMSAVTVSDSARVRSRVRHHGHDPIVGGKSTLSWGISEMPWARHMCRLLSSNNQYYTHTHTLPFIKSIRECCGVELLRYSCCSLNLENCLCGCKQSNVKHRKPVSQDSQPCLANSMSWLES